MKKWQSGIRAMAQSEMISVENQGLESAYKAMAKDTVREKEAHEWVEAVSGDTGSIDPETSSG